MKLTPLPVSLFLIILPLVLVGAYLVVREYDHQTRVALERRSAIASLGATLIHEKFDGIIDIGTSLASRASVYQNTEKGKWDEAIKALEGIPQVFPYIDAVTFLDTSGVLRATIPLRPEVIGENYAYRDYYQGVSKEWKPYVSEAFKRSVDPKDNLVAVAVPIKSPEQKILGILLLTIKVDTIVDWSNEIRGNSFGYFIVIDKNGQLVAHPQMKSGDLMDFSSTAVGQKLLKGEHGVGVFLDPVDKDEDLVAYNPVQDYGFGVIISQPTRVAFAERNIQTIQLVIIWVLVVFVSGLSSYSILRSRAVMKRQRDRESVFLESIGDGVVAIDRNWNITLWNKSASAITGWSKEEAIGKPLRSILKILRERNRKDDISCIEDAVIRGRATAMSDDMLLVKKDGREVSVGDSAAPIFGSDGEVEGAIIVFRDTSKERESAHLRSDFMYASHQLRTPITEALWNLEVGINEQNADKKNEDLRVAHQSLLSVKKLSEHLVSVSEIDQENVAVKLSEVKLIDILAEVQNKLDVETKAREVTISVAPVSPLMAINTDGKLLSRILFEIFENAVIYSHRGAKVDVTATLQEKNLLIEVADTGVGIPEQEQVVTFTKFFRGSNRGSENVGDGLGLYLAKAYIALLGGKIWFESVEGKGTTFFISVPIV